MQRSGVGTHPASLGWGGTDNLGVVSTPRFLLSRRWVLFALAVVVLSFLAWRLGEWQFDRLDERKDRNAQIERNEHHDPVDVSEVSSPGGTVRSADEWRLVTATGTYRTDDQVIVRYRTRDGQAGVDVVVPLETTRGPVVLVDRGWFATANRGEIPTDVPAPPAGEVEVTGWLRVDATGDSTTVDDHSTRAVNSRAIGEALGLETYAGFVDLKAESPEPAQALEPVELPELDNGPHFFYGLQWWFFGVLAVVGFFYLMWDEKRGGTARLRRRSTRHAEDDRIDAREAARSDSPTP